MDKSIIDNLLEKSGGTSVACTIDALIEKAVYGAGASHGKIERGSGKDESKPGKVRRPVLSEERKKQLLASGEEKRANFASSTGMHGYAAKIRAEKSLDERTTDLVKALNVDYGPRKSGRKPGGWRQDPDAGIDRMKEKKMDEEASKKGDSKWSYDNYHDLDYKKKSNDSDLEKGAVKDLWIKRQEAAGKDPTISPKKGDRIEDGPSDKGKYVTGSKTFNNPQDSQDPKIRYKSLDERTSDLHKGFAPEKVGAAIGREYVKNPDSDRVKRVAVKFHSKNRGDSAAQHKYTEGMTNEIWAHNLKLAKKSQQDVVNTWQTGSPFITKGAKVMPLGPGGEVQNLVKDEKEDLKNHSMFDKEARADLEKRSSKLAAVRRGMRSRDEDEGAE